jgi:hypothetical protein
LAPPVQLDGGGRQPQLDFALAGWNLVLVPGDPTPDCRDFAALVQATPTSLPISVGAVERLHRWLFIILSFLANREVGIGPVCGVDQSGDVTWAEWTPPRMKPNKPGITWSPPLLIPSALPEVSAGLASVSADPDLEVIVDRAIGYSLAANEILFNIRNAMVHPPSTSPTPNGRTVRSYSRPGNLAPGIWSWRFSAFSIPTTPSASSSATKPVGACGF